MAGFVLLQCRNFRGLDLFVLLSTYSSSMNNMYDAMEPLHFLLYKGSIMRAYGPGFGTWFEPWIKTSITPKLLNFCLYLFFSLPLSFVHSSTKLHMKAFYCVLINSRDHLFSLELFLLEPNGLVSWLHIDEKIFFNNAMIEIHLCLDMLSVLQFEQCIFGFVALHFLYALFYVDILLN